MTGNKKILDEKFLRVTVWFFQKSLPKNYLAIGPLFRFAYRLSVTNNVRLNINCTVCVRVLLF